MNKKLEQAFTRGYTKRAEELGFDKTAFLAPLLGMGLRVGGQIGGAIGLQSLISKLALRGGKIGKYAKGIDLAANTTGGRGMAAQMGMMTAGGMLGDAVTNPLANKLEGTT